MKLMEAFGKQISAVMLLCNAKQEMMLWVFCK